MSFSVTVLGNQPTWAQCDACYHRWLYAGENECPSCGGYGKRVVRPTRVRDGGNLPSVAEEAKMRSAGLYEKDGNPVDTRGNDGGAQKPSGVIDDPWLELLEGMRSPPSRREFVYSIETGAPGPNFAVESEPDVWVTKGGRQIPVRNMTDSHIENCMSLITRAVGRGRATQNAKYRMLAKELERRQVPEDNAFAPRLMTNEPRRDSQRARAMELERRSEPEPQVKARRRIRLGDKE